MATSERFQILSLSGGGYLGLFTAQILAKLEEESGRPIAERFDLIAGTSIGGILAIALSLQIPTSTLIQFFQKNGTTIFSNRPAPQTTIGKWRDLFRYLKSPKYSASPLESTLKTLLGATRVLGCAKHRVIVPAINLTSGHPQIFKTPHHEAYISDWKERVVDIALATSAAPTYLPLAQVGNHLFVDGGLVANAPDLIAFHEATKFLSVDQSQISMLSIGTTSSNYSISHSMGGSFGAIDWMKDARIFNATISAQQQMTQSMMEHLLTDRYLRVDASQSSDQAKTLALDVATDHAQRTLLGLADSAIRVPGIWSKAKEFLSYTARRPRFYYGENRTDSGEEDG